MATRTKRNVGLLLALLLGAEVVAIACSSTPLSPQAAGKRAEHMAASGVDNRVAGLTPLHLAAMWGDGAAVKRLAAGNLVNQPDRMGLTPLHHAVAGNHAEVVEILLSQGANPNCIVPGTLETPLQEAAFLRDSAIMQLLMKHDANPNLASSDGYTPLLLATQLGHLEEVKLLVAIGADLNTQDAAGRAALHCAALRGHEKIMQGLLAAGVNLNTKDIHGATALALARSPAMAKLLIAAGAGEKPPTTTGLLAENTRP